MAPWIQRMLELPEAGEITAAEPEGQDQASEAAIAALQNMVEKANALGSDDAALQTAITGCTGRAG